MVLVVLEDTAYEEHVVLGLGYWFALLHDVDESLLLYHRICPLLLLIHSRHACS